MAIEEPPAARRHKKDRSSIGSKTASDRSSIGSKTLSFHQKKGRFAGGGAGGGGHAPKSEHLDRLRKNAREDFTRATHKRSQSVHQMVAMYASSASAASPLMNEKAADGQDRQLPRAIAPGGAMSGAGGGGSTLGSSFGKKFKGFRDLVSPFSSGSSAGRPLDPVAQGAGEKMEGQADVDPDNNAELESLSPTAPSSLQQFPEHAQSAKFKSFSGLSNTSDVRARDLKKIHLDEARNVTSHRVGNVKELASSFRGESRPENVEVFHKRHKEQEAEYRHKVHQGKETLKKTSQGTDAMYNFVLKLNLATTEGKARFMKKWAIGRIANGETVSPREGWKFLQSLGIGVQKAKTPVAHRSPSPPSAPANPVSPAGEDPAAAKSPPKPAARVAEAPAAATASSLRGRGRTRNPPASDGPKGESAAWEVAMSQAVGAVVRVDPDACAPKLAFHRRRRSGSGQRKTPKDVPRAPETCRAPKSKSFFFSNSSSETVTADKSGPQQQQQQSGTAPKA
ncbi:unnamed protein product, partial [Scytosiphon promiscuus]